LVAGVRNATSGAQIDCNLSVAIVKKNTSTDARVTVIDLKAGTLSLSLDTFDRIGILEAARAASSISGCFHLIGRSIASLEEIRENADYVNVDT
jgi:hypothetical protein